MGKFVVGGDLEAIGEDFHQGCRVAIDDIPTIGISDFAWCCQQSGCYHSEWGAEEQWLVCRIIPRQKHEGVIIGLALG